MRFVKSILSILLLMTTTLAIGQNGKFRSVNDALSNADKVTELQLSGITDPLPDGISDLKNLKIVRLINLQKDYDLADAIKKLAKVDGVEELHLYGSKHTSLPSEITEFKNLRVVVLPTTMNNSLNEVLDVLIKIRSLEELSLRGFKLTQLPDKISDLKSLKSINLGDNPNLDFEQVFSVLGQLEQLEHLNLDYNKFDSFPASIENLKGLKTLDMEMMYAKFNTAETYQILSKLDSLEHLNISGNFLGSLPDEISELKSLKVLNINGNGFSEEATNKLKKLLPNTEIINDTPY